MQYRLAAKAAIIGVIVIGLQVALSMILGQIRERSWLQTSVEQEIANSAAGPQTLIGPFVLVEWRERIRDTELDAATGKQVEKVRHINRKQLVAPQTMRFQGQAAIEARQRGIYHANLFRSDWALHGTAALKPFLGSSPQGEVLDAQAYLVLGISDQRGITNSPVVQLAGREIAFQPGSKNTLETPAIYADLGPLDLSQPHAWSFDIGLNVMGTGSFAIAPTAEQTDVNLTSSWPHPSFQGRFLPTTREVRDTGFTAHWQISHLARNFDKALAAGQNTSAGARRDAADEWLSVGFIDPVNIYQQSQRAVKYGLLFIVLTFAAFFLIETSQRTPIHPVQYVLVGLALALFFLLLVSLSEHLAFATAYLIAATACVGLIGMYSGAVLHNARKGFAVGAGITALYGIVYGILLSEDNALLMGSLLLFAALAAVMFGTRHVDWYGLMPAATRRTTPTHTLQD